MSIEMAITDALTGLYNRRYMESHLSALVEQAAARGKPLTALVLDIDYFKSINDTHGHDAGDDVLREFATRDQASRSAASISPAATAARNSSIVMPETDMAVATIVAERLRRRIASEPFSIQQGSRPIEVTISIGLATLDTADDNAAHHPQARRPGALSRQARRPEPRRRRRGVIGRNFDADIAAFARSLARVNHNALG